MKKLLVLLLSIPVLLFSMDSYQETKQKKILTPLEQTFFDATHSNNVALFAECLANGVDCNVENEYGKYGYTVLHNICISGRYELLPLILNAANLDINKVDSGKGTALHAAAYHDSDNHEAHCQLLLSLIKRGAHIDAQDHLGDTPLAILLRGYGKPTLYSELLIDQGADITISTSYYDGLKPTAFETIFERAIRTNNPAQVAAFLKSQKITKPVILSALRLARFGFYNSMWGTTMWAPGVSGVKDYTALRNNFACMGRMFMHYYNLMQGLGFVAPRLTDDWQRKPISASIPIEIAKIIAWHSSKNYSFRFFKKRTP